MPKDEEVDESIALIQQLRGLRTDVKAKATATAIVGTVSSETVSEQAKNTQVINESFAESVQTLKEIQKLLTPELYKAAMLANLRVQQNLLDASADVAKASAKLAKRGVL